MIKKLYKSIIFIAICSIMLLINYNNFFNNDKISSKVIILIVLEITSLFIINKYLIKKLNNRILKILIGAGLAVILIFEIISVIYFRVEYNWDFRFIMEGASQLVKTGNTEHMDYFYVFPNNVGTLFLVTLAMKVFANKEIGAYVINIILVFLAAFCSVLVGKKIGGLKLSLNVVIILLTCIPFYLYTPIVYSDTLSVLVPILDMYLYLKFKEFDSCSKRVLYFMLITLVAFLGFIVKPIAAITYIAILIEIMFEKIKNIKYMGASIVLFIIAIVIFNSIVYGSFLKIEKKNNIVYPYTHWIMMGMNKPTEQGGTSVGWGGYSYYDAIYTESQDTYQKKEQANIEVIKQRLKDFGVINYIKFLYNKSMWMWNDGTYYIQAVLKWSPLNSETCIWKILMGEKSDVFINPFMYASQIVMMLFILINAINDFIKKRDGNIRILQMSIIGIFIFLLLWEGRSRYIYCIIPIFSILASQGIINLTEIDLKNKIKNKIKNMKGL